MLNKSFAKFIFKGLRGFNKTSIGRFAFQITTTKERTIFVPYEKDIDFEEEIRVLNKRKNTHSNQEENKLNEYLKTTIASFKGVNLNQGHQKQNRIEELEELKLITWLMIGNEEYLRKFPSTKREALMTLIRKDLDKSILEKTFKEKLILVTENHKTDLSIHDFLDILRCMDGAKKFSELSNIVFNLQKVITPEKFKSLKHPADLIFLIKVCTFLLRDSMNYNNRIILFNLEYIDQVSIFKTCDSYQIKELLDAYNEISSQTKPSDLQKYFSKSLADLQPMLLSKINQELEKQNFSPRSILNPGILFNIIKVYKRIGLNSKGLFDAVEKGILKSFSNQTNFEFKTFFIGFNFVTKTDYGHELLKFFLISLETGKFTKSTLQSYDPKSLAYFLGNLALFEMNSFYSTLVFDEENGYRYLTREKFEKAQKEFGFNKLKQNEIYEIILPGLLSGDFIRNLKDFNKEEIMTISKMLFWLKATDRDHLAGELKPKELDNLRFRLLKMIQMEKRFPESNNEFVADIGHILQKNKQEFKKEYKLGIKFCDFALVDKKIIIELDGSYHFHTDDPLSITNQNKFRNLYILFNKWQMVELNHLEWAKARLISSTEGVLMSKLDALEKNKDILLVSSKIANE